MTPLLLDPRYDRWKTTPPQPDADERRAERAQELAAEGFDDGDERAWEWLCDGADREDVAQLALAAIREDDDLRRDMVTLLRERYVERCAEAYAPDVEAEAQREADEAENDAAWEQRHGRV